MKLLLRQAPLPVLELHRLFLPWSVPLAKLCHERYQSTRSRCSTSLQQLIGNRKVARQSFPLSVDYSGVRLDVQLAAEIGLPVRCVPSNMALAQISPTPGGMFAYSRRKLSLVLYSFSGAPTGAGCVKNWPTYLHRRLNRRLNRCQIYSSVPLAAIYQPKACQSVFVDQIQGVHESPMAVTFVPMSVTGKVDDRRIHL